MQRPMRDQFSPYPTHLKNRFRVMSLVTGTFFYGFVIEWLTEGTKSTSSASPNDLRRRSHSVAEIIV
jgi:hypothetical protein